MLPTLRFFPCESDPPLLRLAASAESTATCIISVGGMGTRQSAYCTCKNVSKAQKKLNNGEAERSRWDNGKMMCTVSGHPANTRLRTPDQLRRQSSNDRFRTPEKIKIVAPHTYEVLPTNFAARAHEQRCGICTPSARALHDTASDRSRIGAARAQQQTILTYSSSYNAPARPKARRDSAKAHEVQARPYEGVYPTA